MSTPRVMRSHRSTNSPQVIAVEAEAAAVERRVLGLDSSLVTMRVAEHLVERPRDPVGARASVTVIASIVSDRLVPVVLTDEAVGLQPPRERRLGDLARRDLTGTPRLGAVPLELVAGSKRPRLDEPAAVRTPVAARRGDRA